MNLSITYPRLAGRVAYFLPNWEVLTQDQWVLQTVADYHLELTEAPTQARVPQQMKCSQESKSQIDSELQELLSKGAVVETQVSLGNFVSQIFLVEKKDGGLRPVINLKGLDQFVKAEHFKIEGLRFAPRSPAVTGLDGKNGLKGTMRRYGSRTILMISLAVKS